jgi:hypothetical protein
MVSVLDIRGVRDRRAIEDFLRDPFPIYAGDRN